MPLAANIENRMALSGDGLSTGTIQWGQRKEPDAAIGLTRRDLRLMALIQDVNYLSASQLTVLGWGASCERAGQKRLKRLHDAGYLDRFRPIPEVGTAEWNYRLSTQGWTALATRGIVPHDCSYTPTKLTSISYTEHDLQLATLILQIAQAAVPDQAGGLIDRMPFVWRGPRSGLIDTDSDGEFECSASIQLPKGTRLHPESSRQGYLEPDATLIGQSGNDRWAVLIEYDRTNRPHKQIDRLRRYDYWLLDGWRQSHFAEHSAPPSVIFLTAREQPLRRLIQTADQTFTAWHSNEHAGPREGTHPARQRTVFTSRERILAGDWTMQRTPSLPPALREDGARCSPRSLEYNLPYLFAVA
jgi:hypothetical protein